MHRTNKKFQRSAVAGVTLFRLVVFAAFNDLWNKFLLDCCHFFFVFCSDIPRKRRRYEEDSEEDKDDKSLPDVSLSLPAELTTPLTSAVKDRMHLLKMHIPDRRSNDEIFKIITVSPVSQLQELIGNFAAKDGLPLEDVVEIYI